MSIFSAARKSLFALASLTVAVMAGCGGGGGAGGWGDDGSAAGGTGTAASVKMTTSAPSVGSDGKTVATITAYVADGANRALVNQLVDFRSSDAGVILQPSASPALTDETGSVSAQLQIIDPSNRQVVVSAGSGSASGSVSVEVVGTVVSVDGPGAIAFGIASEFTVAARDSAGNLVAGKSLTVSSAAGNGLSASTVTTDANGRARFSVTGLVAGADTISVAGLGLVSAKEIVVSDSLVAFVSPDIGAELAVGGSHAIQVVVTQQGTPQSGVTVDFFTTRGTISAQAQTDGSGRATASLSAPTAGPTTVTARVGDLMSSRAVEFVSTTPAQLNLQASPANVGVNLGAATTNSSQLIALVRDSADNPVKGQTVAFSADADPSGGRLEPATAVTDASGVASVAFYPGPTTTGNNQIVMRATVVGAAVSGTTTLTASKQELFVRIGTGNQMSATDTTYQMPWEAVVTDASGNPVPNAVVQASLVGVGFYKGRYQAVGLKWVPLGDADLDPRYWCPSEDTNGNLRLDAGEDLNGDGQLTPGNVATAFVETAGGSTDDTGFARIQVKYPKEYGSWTQVRLIVTITTIAGTEGTAVRLFNLPVLADDLAVEGNPPGGLVSVFGRSADCSSSQ